MQLKYTKSVFSDDTEGYELHISFRYMQLFLTNFFNFNINQVITVYAVPICHFDILYQREEETSLSTLTAIIALPNSVLNLYNNVIDPVDSIYINNSRSVNISPSVGTNGTGASISSEHHLSSNTSPAHIMVRSSHSMTEVSVMDYQSSNSHLTINGRQNRDRSIDIHGASLDRSVHENINQREEHSHLSSSGPIDSKALTPSGLSILKHLTSFDSSEIQEQQSSAEETKSQHTTTNSKQFCVGTNNVSKSNQFSREQFHVLDFSRRKHPNRRRYQSTINNFDALDCEAQPSSQQNRPADEAQPDVEISQVNKNSTLNEQRNNFPAAASELLASGYNRHQIDRALDKFYQNRGHNNPTFQELRYIVVVENSETDDEST